MKKPAIFAKSYSSLILFCLGFCIHVSASDLNPIPLEPTHPFPHLGWLYFANDGLGNNYGDEEDDLRTYGLTTGFAFANRFLVTLDWESFTDRNYDLAHSMRNDEIKSLIGTRYLSIVNKSLSLWSMAGVGGMFYDNFKTLRLQEKAHAMGNLRPRTVPQVYDVPSQHGLGFLYSELYFPSTGINLTQYAHLTNDLDGSIAFSLSYWIVKEWEQAKIGLTWQYNRAESAGSVVRNVLAAENGLWLKSQIMIGPVVLERGCDLLQFNQVGNSGFRFTTGIHENRSQGYRFTYSFGFPIGHNSNCEMFQIHPFANLPKLSLFLSNYQTEDTYNYDQWRRIKKAVTVGPQWYLHDPEQWNLFNFFVYGGVGVTREALTTGDMDQFRSRILSTATLPTALAGVGYRVEIPDFIFKNRGRYFGADLKAEIYGVTSTESLYTNPYFLLSWDMFISER